MNVQVKILRHPYPQTIPDDEFDALIVQLSERLEDDIDRNHEAGRYRSGSLGLCLLDPTVPLTVASTDAVLALVAIGSEGRDFLPNAVAKACETRDFGVNCGTLAFAQPQRLADGQFRWGHSAIVDGTIVGASAQVGIQDRALSERFASDFNVEVNLRRMRWVGQGRGGYQWFAEPDTPNPIYSAVAAMIDE
jgi:hypothetical protein